MKKLTLLALSTLVAVTVIGCSSGGDDAAAGQPAPANTGGATGGKQQPNYKPQQTKGGKTGSASATAQE